MLVALFRRHTRDPLSLFISAVTWGAYVHAALYFETSGELVEAYWPAVRRRTLAPGETSGIDFFRLAGLDANVERHCRSYADAAVAAHEAYSIEGLFRFLAPARVFLGDGREGCGRYPTFCSQFVMEVVKNGANLQLQNAPSFEVDPTHLSWSPLLIRTNLPHL